MKRVLSLAFLSLLLGCPSYEEQQQKRLEDYVAAHKPRTAEVAEQLKAIHAKVKALPEVKTDDELSVTDLRIYFRGREDANARMIQLEDLAEPGKEGERAALLVSPMWLTEPAGLMLHGVKPNEYWEAPREGEDLVGLAAYAEHLETKLTYVVVFRLTTYSEPVANLDDKTFKPGEAWADVFVFKLDDQTVVGKLGIGAKSHDEVTVRGNIESVDLEHDLTERLVEGTLARFEKLGAIPEK